MAEATEEKHLIVYSDIETDSLFGNILLQIAAVTEDGETFNIHINPHENLPVQCSNITGLYYFKKNLYKNGRLVPSVSIRKGLRSFRDWILAFKQPVVLVFHNGFSFDIKVLLRTYMKLNVKFPENVSFISDTLPAFRKFTKNSNLKDHKLLTLADFTKVKLENAHDALADSQALKNICDNFTKQNE
jgi:DNA polymerase III alpha subunit (gram-positive type)